MKAELYKEVYVEMFRIVKLLQNDPEKEKQYNQTKPGSYLNRYDMKDSQFVMYDSGIIVYTKLDKECVSTFCVYEVEDTDEVESYARCTIGDEYMWIHSVLDYDYTPHLYYDGLNNAGFDLYNDNAEIESQRFQNQLILDCDEYIDYMDLEYTLRGHIPSNMYISFNLSYAPKLSKEALESLIIELKKVI